MKCNDFAALEFKLVTTLLRPDNLLNFNLDRMTSHDFSWWADLIGSVSGDYVNWNSDRIQDLPFSYTQIEFQLCAWYSFRINYIRCLSYVPAILQHKVCNLIEGARFSTPWVKHKISVFLSVGNLDFLQILVISPEVSWSISYIIKLSLIKAH